MPHQSLLAQVMSSFSSPQASLRSLAASILTVTLVRGPMSSAMMSKESVTSRTNLWDVLPGLTSLI